MKRHLLLFLLFACTTLGAQTNVYKVEDIPMVHLQDARRYVSNPDGILSETTVYAIDTTLYALERETGIQTLVVAVGQIEGGDCFDFAYRLGRENGVGRKETDNGLVILLVTGERCIQFATGYGLEGDLPQAIPFPLPKKKTTRCSCSPFSSAASSSSPCSYGSTPSNANDARNATSISSVRYRTCAGIAAMWCASNAVCAKTMISITAEETAGPS